MDLPATTSIYVLKLEKGKYYIGKSQSPQQRINRHFSGHGAAWTKKYKPLQIVEVVSDCDPLMEDTYTKKYMANFGISNVRGGSYCQIQLDDKSLEVLEREIRASHDNCYHCGQSGHYIEKCPRRTSKKKNTKRENIKKKNTKKSGCSRCGRQGHNVQKCYAKTHLNGEKLRGCDRCGRFSHTADNCFAKTTITGQVIEPDDQIMETSGPTDVQIESDDQIMETSGPTDVQIEPDDQIMTDLIDKYQICTHCSQTGHFAKDCQFKHSKQTDSNLTNVQSKPINQPKPINPEKCYRCHRTGHRSEKCKFKRDANDRKITWNGCTRCGRKSHWAFRCKKDKDIFNRPIGQAPMVMLVAGVTGLFGN